MKTLLTSASLSLLLIVSAGAQERSHVAFNIGAGFTEPVGHTGRVTDMGWNVGAGVGYNFNPYVGLLVDANYSSFGINSTTLANVGAPGGGFHIFSATLDPIIHIAPKSHADVYITGGGGIYHRNQDLTAPATAITTGFDPFFGFFPVAVSTNQVLASYTVNKPGVDIGMGIAFGSKWHGKFFAEAKYNRIFMRDSHTDYVPVTFGFRW
ncbi:MAG TPA: outer membrane beta-barrel protein [Candidatus Limnocylindrales bacterium]|nr:outer membrane beta-barrel protein [Candidatus Limnocylindrales bacterium]